MFRYILLLILLPTCVGCHSRKEGITPKEKMITEAVYTTVTVQPDSLYHLRSKVTAVIDNCLVSEGDLVTPTTAIIALLRPQSSLAVANASLSLELSRKQYQSDYNLLKTIEEQMRLSKLQLKDDSLNYHRQLKLWNQNIGSQINLEKKALAFENAKTTYENLKLSYYQKKQALATAWKIAQNKYKSALSTDADYTLTSAINGRVYAISTNVGETVQPGQTLAIIGSASRFILELLVDEVDIVKIKRGQKVWVSLDAYKDNIFEAHIVKINPRKDERNQTFLVEAQFVAPPPTLYPGLSGEGNVVIHRKKSGMVIPRSYLTKTQQVRTSEGLIDVELGIQSLDEVEITAGIDLQTIIYKPEQ